MASKKQKKSERWAETETITKIDTPKPKSKKIAFNSWFVAEQQKRTVKAWQTAEILIFFKKRGLSECEEKEVYDKVFKKF